MGAFSDLLGQLDPDPRRRGTQFEHICKWYLTNDPLYKARLHHVWLWKEWPDRWSDTEAGIDLVAEDYDGQLWAVQAKAYAEHRDIPKRELDKFLSESNQTMFSRRLLIATTDGLHHIARRTIGAQEKPVSVVGLSDLREADEYLEWPESPEDLRPSPPTTPLQPHDYQIVAINDVVKGFDADDRGQLIMACGTGKTLTSLFINERLGAQRTLVLVPSLSLLKQTLRVWSANKPDEFVALPVCSDSTVSRGEDAAVMYASDLGVPVTTNPADIAVFLRKRGPRVIFSTYQSSPHIAEAFKLGRVPMFDLVIADEAHRCAGPVSSDFATILDPAAIKTHRRLFMTATPRYFSGRVIREAKEADFAYASMDDKEKFGAVFHRLGFSAAIKRGLLTDYQVAVVGVDDAMYREWAERGALVTLDGRTPISAQALAGQIGLAKAMRKYRLQRTISFHSRVSSAKQFATSMRGVLAWMPARQRPNGRLWAEHASGEMSAGQRGRLIQRLSELAKGERGLLTNARCLAEGVDVPALDGVAFIDPRRSEVDIVQAVGRAIRLAPEKTVGTIVIPVFIDTADDPEIALNASTFKPIWDIIKALRSHDDALAEQLDELRRHLGRQGGTIRLPNKIHLDLPVGVTTEFAHAFDVRLVEQTTASWEFWYGVTEEFVAREGHSRVSQDYTINGYQLGTWINNQRSLKAKHNLSADRTMRLEALPGWTWQARDDQWEEGFDHLRAYVAKHGSARVPQSHRTVDEFRLGGWVATQRIQFEEGSFNPDRQRQLEELPGWAWKARDALWEEGFSHLQRYGARPLKSYVTADGYPLGKWAARQRQWRAEGTLDSDRAYRLQGLPGWTWDAIHDSRWEAGYSHLLDHVTEHGDAHVSLSYEAADHYRLGAWVSQQRLRYGKGILEANRVQRLEEVQGWAWTIAVDMWPERFDRLKAYVKANGHARVPQTHVDDEGHSLGHWVGTQRALYRKGTLADDRVELLQNLPGWIWKAKSGPRRS